MSDKHRPVQAPPPFPPPVLLSARRLMGEVLTSAVENDGVTQAPSLVRKSSLAGNILLVQDDQNPKAEKKTFMLQRKLKASTHGSVRLGFVLRDPSKSESGVWELVPKSNDGGDGDLFEMVAVKIEPKNSTENPLVDLSALQWIAANDPEGKGHLLGPAIIAADDAHYYTITPFQNGGSLLDYCAEVGQLPENEARFIFRQMLKVRIVRATFECMMSRPNLFSHSEPSTCRDSKHSNVWNCHTEAWRWSMSCCKERQSPWRTWNTC